VIDKQHVRHIAKLARLIVTEQESELFAMQIGSILEYIDQLNSIDTRTIEPTAYVSPRHDPLRNDEEQKPMPREDLLLNGPCVKNGYFAVPKVKMQ
jgi:aspartyl-tRNA(Asn)/glutamyl-tRNA(Gln) amidotransferase subunit C